MAECLIALGSNLGDRAATLSAAVEQLRTHTDLTVRAVSRWHSFAAIGGPENQQDFLNGALRLSTSLSPQQLLILLRQIETQLGRERHERWDARTLDLDLLLYDDLILREPQLELPHPRMAFRRFVLEPAAEIAAEMVHPTTGWTLACLLDHLESAPPYFAVTGVNAPLQQAIAGRAATQLAAELVASPAFPAVGETVASLGCPGLAPAAAIQFLQQRAKRLVGEVNAARLSDFWLPESLAWGELHFGDSEPQRQLLASYEQIVPQLSTPKFIVLIEPVAAERQTACAMAIERCLAKYSAGPVLRVAGDEPDWAVKETVAAIEAMQS